MKKYLIVVIILFLFSCKGVKVIIVTDSPKKKPIYSETPIKSGMNRDLRRGFYYDYMDKNCKMISYSSGPGCKPPPFKTREECESCNRNRLR